MLREKFNSVEVLEMAKDIEKRGQEFYEYQADKVEDDEIRELFLKLASDEEDHYKRFSDLEEAVKSKTREEVEYLYDEEVSAYLNALVEFSVFPAEAEVADMDFSELSEVIELAIGAEKDSILFYTEMLPHNEGNTKKVLNQLIKEEKQHLLDLVKLEAQLA